jgi:hypothetical protein
MFYTGRLLGKEYGELKMLTPISFTCEVKGRELIATVIGTLDHPIDFFYRIRFSDGYISDFTPSQGGTWYDMANEKEYKDANKHPYSPYAEAIQNDLRDLHQFQIYVEAYCFRIPVKGAMTNVYVLRDGEEEGGQYNVKFGGQYQFSLRRAKDTWFAGSKYDKKANVDSELARNVYLMIEAHQ